MYRATLPDTRSVADSSPLLLTEREAADQLRMSVRSLFTLRKSGKIGYVPFGVSGVRYLPEQLAAWIAAARTDASNGQS